MTTNTKMKVIFLCLLLLIIATSASFSTKSRSVCVNNTNVTCYLHDILFDGKNKQNFTSIIAAAPTGGSLTNLAPDYNHFGNIVVFDDPITLDNNLTSTPIGRARGSYLYSGKEEIAAWFGFSIVFESEEYRGSINLVGAGPMLDKPRDFSVIGGTGDFFMALGFATFTTDAREGDAYFRLRISIKMYNC